MLTIAERRRVAERTVAEPPFVVQLRADPRAAVETVVGRSFPISHEVRLLEETPTRWAFVLPDLTLIESDLPDPTDPRTAVENQVYTLLRAEPDLIESAMRSPEAFLAEQFDIHIDAVDLRRETAATTILVIPCQTAREELDDDMLDLVTGGSSAPLNNVETTGSAKS